MGKLATPWLAVLETAFAAHQRGDYLQAEGLYQRVLAVAPNQPDALAHLGLLNLQLGRSDMAISLIEKALQRASKNAVYYSYLGDAYRARGKFDDARRAYQKALKLDPNLVPALGNFGLTLQDQGKLDEALAAFQRVLKIMPGSVDALINIGTVFQDKSDFESAISSFQRALELEPARAEAHFNLGEALAKTMQFGNAVAHFQRAVELDPCRSESWVRLGKALVATDQKLEAGAAYKKALSLEPDNPGALVEMASLLRQAGYPTRALAMLQRVLELHPNDRVATINMGIALLDAGEPAQAIACYEQGLQAWPNDPILQSSLLFSCSYLPMPLEEMFKLHQKVGKVLESVAPTQLLVNVGKASTSKKRLRIGYVSADFYQHPVASLIEPVLRQHDLEAFEIFCYSDVSAPDEVTERLRTYADTWRETHHLTHESLAEQIAHDRIDILVDLGGHTGANRLPVFARKPAPIQVTWLGYFDTTGLMRMDYILLDQFSIEATAQRFTEQVWSFPSVRFCYGPPENAPPVCVPPVAKLEALTFGCFNNLAKLNDRVVALWAKLLASIPTTRLLLKNRSLADPDIREKLLGRFGKHGIASERIELRAGSLHHIMLGEYADVDIALDPFPYTGGLTSLEALWMGVPLVTLLGDSIIGRQTAGFLQVLGLDDLIAHSEEDYLRIVAALAANHTRLNELRAGLRERMHASPLCDAERFTRQLEMAYRQMRDRRERGTA